MLEPFWAIRKYRFIFFAGDSIVESTMPHEANGLRSRRTGEFSKQRQLIAVLRRQIDRWTIDIESNRPYFIQYRGRTGDPIAINGRKCSIGYRLEKVLERKRTWPKPENPRGGFSLDGHILHQGKVFMNTLYISSISNFHCRCGDSTMAMIIVISIAHRRLAPSRPFRWKICFGKTSRLSTGL